MTKTTKTASLANDAVASFSKAFDAAQKMEVPAAARDFVIRTAETAKDRAESVHTGAANVATRAEKLATAFVGGYANFARGMIDASLSNVQHALSTVEKVAGAKSLNEAVQIQADYVRESARVNFDRVKSAAETARETVMDSAKSVQAEISNLYAKKAA